MGWKRSHYQRDTEKDLHQVRTCQVNSCRSKRVKIVSCQVMSPVRSRIGSWSTSDSLTRLPLSSTDGSDLTLLGRALCDNRYNDLQVLDLSFNSISSGQQLFIDGLKALRHGLSVLNIEGCGMSLLISTDLTLLDLTDCLVLT